MTFGGGGGEGLAPAAPLHHPPVSCALSCCLVLRPLHTLEVDPILHHFPQGAEVPQRVYVLHGLLHTSLRFGLGRFTTEAEVQQWRDTLREAAEEADAGVQPAPPKEDNTPRGKAPEPVAQVSVEPAAKKQRVAEA